MILKTKRNFEIIRRPNINNCDYYNFSCTSIITYYYYPDSFHCFHLLIVELKCIASYNLTLDLCCVKFRVVIIIFM